MTDPQPPADVNYQGTMLIDRDTEHLRILSICWYVAAGLALFASCFPIIYVVLGLIIALSPGSMGRGPPPPAAMGWAFFLMGSIFTVMGWAIAILGFITARSLPKRRNILVCYIAAGFACLQIPIGTTLGVFTFVVLSRPQVRESFT